MSEPSKAQRLVDLAYKFANDIMLGTDKGLMPMFVIERNDERDVIGIPYKDDDEKRTMVINVALEIAAKGADAWSFVTETWFAYRAKNEPLGTRPSRDPNRQEGVMCMASEGMETLLYTWITQRDEKGNCTALVKQSEAPAHFDSWISVALNRAMKLHKEF